MSGRDASVSDRPLSGLRIAVTRPAEQAPALVEGLRELGAEPFVSPTIRITDPHDPGPLLEALQRLGQYDWVVFTSANGVTRFWQALERVGALALPGGVRVAAIGPATAEALELRGVEAELVPEEYVAEAVAEALIGLGDLKDRYVLLPRAAGARKVLPDRLRAVGAKVDEVVAYETSADERGIRALRAGIDGGAVDMITFTAASTVRCFVNQAGSDVGAARVAVIGPITAEAARSLGLRVDVEAGEYTIPGLLQAICRYYSGGEGRD